MPDRQVRFIELTAEDCEAIENGEIVEQQWPDNSTSAIIHANQSEQLQRLDMPSDFMVEITDSELSELSYGKCMVSEGESGTVYCVLVEVTPEPEAEQVMSKWEQSPDVDYGMIRFEQL